MGRIALLFPGQGAQIVGMGLSLLEKYPIARSMFDRAAAVVGYDLAKLCIEGPAEELDSTEISQPAIFTHSIAALEVLRLESPEVVENCEAAAGLSLGEYTALTFSGVFEFEDGLRLVQTRGKAMQDASDAIAGGMVSILGMELDKIEELCVQAKGDGTLQVANILCPNNIVVSGTNSACERIAELAEAAGAMKAIPLAVTGAFHTSLMQPADTILTEALAATKMSKPRIPVFSNVDAKPHDDPEEIRQILVKQILSPVLWEQSIRNLLAQGFDTFYELGPGRVLRGLMKRIDRKINCRSATEPDA